LAAVTETSVVVTSGVLTSEVVGSAANVVDAVLVATALAASLTTSWTASTTSGNSVTPVESFEASASGVAT
jgi:hypothetical protein